MNKYKYLLVPEMLEWVPSIIYCYNDILYFIKAQQIGKFNKHVLYHIYRLNYYSRIAKTIININYYVIINTYIYIYEKNESRYRCVFSYLYGIFSYLYFLCWLLQCNYIPWPLLTILLVVVIIIVVIIIKNNIFDE